MKNKDTLYIKVLIWAYKKQEEGFTWRDIEENFRLNREQLRWIQKIFRPNLPPSDNLFDWLNDNQINKEYLVITAKGTSAAIDYLNLKQSEKSSKQAMFVAITAIVIGIVVGLLQIFVQLGGKLL